MPSITTTDKVEIHYTAQGEGPSIVLLHGLGSAGADWQPQTEQLQRDFQVITVDMRGHGESADPEGRYSIERLARDVVEVMDALGVASAHLIGISMGGALAFEVAVQQPERVTSLVIVNSGPTAKTGSVKYWCYLQLRKLMAWFMTPAQAGPKIAGKLFPEPDMEDKRQAFIQRVSQMNPVAYRKALFALLRWDVVDKLGAMWMPTLYLTGEHDYTPPQAKEHFAAMMPNARVEVIPRAHHAAPMEYPEAFNAALIAFLDSVRGTASLAETG